MPLAEDRAKESLGVRNTDKSSSTIYQCVGSSKHMARVFYIRSKQLSDPYRSLCVCAVTAPAAIHCLDPVSSPAYGSELVRYPVHILCVRYLKILCQLDVVSVTF